MRSSGLSRRELLVAGGGAYAALALGGCGWGGADSEELTFWR